MQKVIEELWRPIKGFEGRYEISNMGRVKSTPTIRVKNVKILKLTIEKNGYYRVTLSSTKNVTHLVHRLVSIAFLENPLILPQVNHKDLNKGNNAVSNLEWCTPSQNTSHAHSNRIITSAKYWKGKFNEDHNLSKPVHQYDLNNVFIKRWPSVREIIRSLKIHKVEMACNGKRANVGGFIWKYV